MSRKGEGGRKRDVYIRYTGNTQRAMVLAQGIETLQPEYRFELSVTKVIVVDALLASKFGNGGALF